MIAYGGYVVDQFFSHLAVGYPHPVTHEYVLSYEEIIRVVSHINQYANAVILGGDILDVDDQYTYMNWYYEHNDMLTHAENSRLSCDKALQHIASLSAPMQYHYILVLN